MRTPEEFLDGLSNHIFWDVDRSKVSAKTHERFLITRVMDRGNREDAIATWNQYGEQRIKNALTQAPALHKKTISFFANQFEIPREAFRAYSKKPSNWDA